MSGVFKLHRPIILAAIALAATPYGGSGQQPPRARPLGATTARATDLFVRVATVRPLPGGRILINDTGARRLLMLDSNLAILAVILDTVPRAAGMYGRGAGGLIAYRGDSSLFVVPSDLSMLNIDGDGQVKRELAVPKPNDVSGLLGGATGKPGFDAVGRLVYRGRSTASPASYLAGSATTVDSAPIVRLDLASRRLDTAGWVRVPHSRLTTTDSTGQNRTGVSIINPLPVVDDWAVLDNGTIAILRGLGYFVDWVNPDGTRTSSHALPFEWRRLNDDDKARFLDSTRAALERMRTEATARDSVRGPMAPFAYLNAAGIPAAAFYRVGAATSFVAPLIFVAPAELPDYAPPFASGALRGDTESNLWVRTTLGVAGGPIYDVVSRGGLLFDRVYVPPGRVIVGFGPGGVVYMVVQEGSGVRLERARVR
jgi:hypothetical protein